MYIHIIIIIIKRARLSYLLRSRIWMALAQGRCALLRGGLLRDRGGGHRTCAPRDLGGSHRPCASNTIFPNNLRFKQSQQNNDLPILSSSVVLCFK